MADKPEASQREVAHENPGEKPDFSDVLSRPTTMPQRFPEARNFTGSLPNDFNFIDMKDAAPLFNDQGFITREALQKAPGTDKISTPDKDAAQDDIKTMLKNFDIMSREADDKDGGAKGISRDDIAKYNWDQDLNHIDPKSAEIVPKTRDGLITREALDQTLKRKDLDEMQRDDLEYMKHQYRQIKDLGHKDNDGGRGISKNDIFASNNRIKFAAFQAEKPD